MDCERRLTDGCITCKRWGGLGAGFACVLLQEIDFGRGLQEEAYGTSIWFVAQFTTGSIPHFLLTNYDCVASSNAGKGKECGLECCIAIISTSKQWFIIQILRLAIHWHLLYHHASNWNTSRITKYKLSIQQRDSRREFINDYHSIFVTSRSFISLPYHTRTNTKRAKPKQTTQNKQTNTTPFHNTSTWRCPSSTSSTKSSPY